MCELHRSVISGSEEPRPIKMYSPAINKENIREEELPASLVFVNPDTGQSVVDKDLSLSLSNLLCACLNVSAYTCACVFYNNT